MELLSKANDDQTYTSLYIQRCTQPPLMMTKHIHLYLYRYILSHRDGCSSGYHYHPPRR